MVGPATDRERGSLVRKLKAGFVVLVALSAGLMTLQAAAGPVWFATATLVGGAVGLVLVRIAFPRTEDLTRGEGRFR